jgi:hypothetical protein
VDGGHSGIAAGDVSGWDIGARLRRLNWKQWVLLASWALFMVWTGLGIFGDGAEALYPTHPANP